MGLSGWQQNLAVSQNIAQDLAQFGDTQQKQDLAAAFIGIGAIALIALLIAAPELIPFLAADAAETGAAEAPAWAIDALDNPGNYSQDTIDLARSISKSPPSFTIPDSELPF